MTTIEILFWAFTLVIFYAYFGYGLVLYTLVKIRERIFPDLKITNPRYEPTVSLIVPC